MSLKSSIALLGVALTTSALAQPIIKAQPQDQAVPYGGATTLFIQVEGAEPIEYQWFLNSSTDPIPNATNATLVISNATPADQGDYRVRLTQAGQVVWSRPAQLTVFTQSLSPFGTITLAPAFELNGAGDNVDSIAFWEAPIPTNTLMFVTAKGNHLLEVWQYPFQGNEQTPRSFPANINGVGVDQEKDLLYVTDQIVSVLSLPDLQLQGTFGQGIIGVGENNIDILKNTNGQTVIYVSEDHRVHRFDAASTNHLGSFAPTVSSIETVLADDFYQMILVPEEQGPAGNPGVYAYHPDGTPFLKNGTNVFGNSGIFDSDEEGILLYTFPSTGSDDNGAGFIVVTDQKSDVTDFEFFDRQTWTHLGTLRLQGVSNTDGIASTQQSMPGYPLGLFAAINNDTTTVGLGWDVIFQAAGFNPLPRVLRVTPAKASVTRGKDLTFTIEFNQPVTNFNNAADLVISHVGTTNTGVTITGSGTRYQLTLTGIGGQGYLVVALKIGSDIQNLQGQLLASTVTSVPVFVRSPYQAWAEQHGLVAGNDGYSSDPDNDYASNLEEFATDRDPLNPNDVLKENATIRGFNGDDYFTYTFPVRNGAVFSGINDLSATVDDVHYLLSGAFDLTSFNRPLVEITPALGADLPTPNNGWTYRTLGLQQSLPAESGFIRRHISPFP